MSTMLMPEAGSDMAIIRVGKDGAIIPEAPEVQAPVGAAGGNEVGGAAESEALTRWEVDSADERQARSGEMD